jgi:hypothetical protein
VDDELAKLAESVLKLCVGMKKYKSETKNCLGTEATKTSLVQLFHKGPLSKTETAYVLLLRLE